MQQVQVSVIKKIRQFSKIEEEKKMKLPELKKRFTRKYVIRIIAGVLVVYDKKTRIIQVSIS